MTEQVRYEHYSPRASEALQSGLRVFELALPRSNRKIHINPMAETVARGAAAKLCQRQGLSIIDVWTEDGEHPDFGWYRMFYVIAGADKVRH